MAFGVEYCDVESLESFDVAGVGRGDLEEDEMVYEREITS